MDKPVSAWRKRLKFNQFEFVSVVGSELILGAAIVDLGLVSNAFVYAYQPTTGRFEEFSFTQPLARKTDIEPFPKSARATFPTSGARLHIVAYPSPACRCLHLYFAGLPAVSVLHACVHYDPLHVFCRASYSG